jgi:hypothetical protein
MYLGRRYVLTRDFARWENPTTYVSFAVHPIPSITRLPWMPIRAYTYNLSKVYRSKGRGEGVVEWLGFLSIQPSLIYEIRSHSYTACQMRRYNI